jgi:hypothetical protein
MNAGEVIVSYCNIQRALQAAGQTTGGFESARTASEAGIDQVYQRIRAQLADSAAAAAAGAVPEDVASEWVAQLSEALAKLEAAEKAPGVFTALEDETASLLQTFLAERAAEGSSASPAQAGGFEARFDDHDIAGYLGSLVHWIRGLKKHPWQAPPASPEPCPHALRVAVLGDWGTGLYGAPICAKSIQKDPKKYGLLLHLGDVYYSGIEREVAERFLALWPNVPGAVSRALNSNHEMYSGGYAYFDMTLKQFKQSSSCFAMQNANWLLVGLDSAYAEHDLAHDQAAWLAGLIAAASGRKVVLFTHHQPFSLLSGQGPKLVKKLGGLLAARKIFAWYWGHEHCCVLYDKHPVWEFHGRCVGHGGYPYFRARPRGAELVSGSAEAGWYRLPSRNLVPGGLLLDGPNPYLGDRVNDYGPNGYATLEFNGEHLTEFLHDPTGEILWQQKLA